MFPDNIESKIIWDDIQEEFGSTERLIIAFGDKQKSILENKKAHTDLLNFVNDLEELEVVDYVTSINSSMFDDYEQKGFPKMFFNEYEEYRRESFLSVDNNFISVFVTPHLSLIHI